MFKVTPEEIAKIPSLDVVIHLRKNKRDILLLGEIHQKSKNDGKLYPFLKKLLQQHKNTCFMSEYVKEYVSRSPNENIKKYRKNLNLDKLKNTTKVALKTLPRNQVFYNLDPRVLFLLDDFPIWDYYIALMFKEDLSRFKKYIFDRNFFIKNHLWYYKDYPVKLQKIFQRDTKMFEHYFYRQLNRVKRDIPLAVEGKINPFTKEHMDDVWAVTYLYTSHLDKAFLNLINELEEVPIVAYMGSAHCRITCGLLVFLGYKIVYSVRNKFNK